MTAPLDTRRLRVVMVTPRALPDLGGIESHVAEVSKRLVERGHDVEVLATDRTGALPKVGNVDGVRIRRARAYPARRDYYLSPRLFLSVLRARADVVHVQGIHTLVPLLAMAAAWLARTPYVVTFHTGGSSSALRSSLRRWQFALLAPLLRRAAGLVAVCEFEARRFEAVLGWDEGSIPVIRNGGTLPQVGPVRRDPDLVVSPGRLERYKGHHRLIAALPHLLSERPAARLSILGAGPYRDELESAAQRLGVGDRVVVDFIDPTNRAEMARRLSSAGVVALLSEYEAHPVAVMEALACQTPAVVARTSGLDELVRIGWAAGVDIDARPEDVAAALLGQLESPVVPAPAELPTWETCVVQLLDEYDNALSPRGRHGVTG